MRSSNLVGTSQRENIFQTKCLTKIVLSLWIVDRGTIFVVPDWLKC